MKKYIIKRILQSIPILFIVSIISFLIIYMAPGDPVNSYISADMTPEDINNIRENLGLNKPIYIQYIIWLKNILLGDFGYSLVDFRPVGQEILTRIPATFLLMGSSLLLSMVIGISLGLISAYYKDTIIDKTISIISYIGISTPVFWFALVLIIIFSVKLGILPSVGMRTPGNSSIIDVLKHLIMPTIVLSYGNASVISRYIRNNAIQEISKDYVKTAKAKGLKSYTIYKKHILRNILLPIITILGMSIPNLIGGAFITETVFGWPGMGRMGINAINSLDYPIIMAITIISSILLILGNLLSDILYSIADPRIKVVE